MELLVAVAVGLNPYAGAVVLAALAAFTSGVPLSETGLRPGRGVGARRPLYGAAMPVDFVLSKFVRLAPRLRTVSHVLAPLTAGLEAITVQQSALPAPLVTAGRRWSPGCSTPPSPPTRRGSSRSPEYPAGHIPVLIAAAVGGVCVLPLGLVLPGLGWASRR